MLVYPGDGAVACTPNEGQPISSNYSSSGVGTLACDQGKDIAYPEGAPGYVYDPTGYLLTLPGRQVSASPCNDMTACNA